MVKTLQKKFIIASMTAVTILLATLIGTINILNYISVTDRRSRMLDELCETEARPERYGFDRGDDGMTAGDTYLPPDREGFGERESKETGPAPGLTGNDGKAEEGMPSTVTGVSGENAQARKENRTTGGRRGQKTSKGLFGRGFTMDDMMSLRYFTVWFDRDGRILKADVSRIYSVSEEEAAAIGENLYVPLGPGEQKRGISGSFRYALVSRTGEDPVLQTDTSDDSSDASSGGSVQASQEAYSRSGETALPEGDDVQTASGSTGEEACSFLVAMDMSADLRDLLTVLGISCVIALLCWLAMLIPVFLLARQAIAPVALSIERQKQFVTNAGHELKTPVAIIQTNTEALELFNGESKWTRNIRTQTERLNELMQNLLTLSKMDESALQMKMSPFSAGELVSEVWENFAGSAEAKNLHFIYEKPGQGSDSAMANRESIARLLSILFDNAVKYTPSGGRIEVTVSAESGKIRLIQSNTIDGESELPENPDRLFERFYRADQDRSRKKGGFGIGLSAARAIAEANRGSIRARTGNGRISFIVSLRKE